MAWQEKKGLAMHSCKWKGERLHLSLFQTTPPLKQHIYIPSSELLNLRNYRCLFTPALCWSESGIVLDYSRILKMCEKYGRA